MDFAISVDHRLKINESEKINKCRDFFKELKKLWNMKVKEIPIEIGALGTIPSDMEKKLMELEIRGRMETLQTSVLLKSG